jgi:hypothetical protein
MNVSLELTFGALVALMVEVVIFCEFLRSDGCLFSWRELFHLIHRSSRCHTLLLVPFEDHQVRLAFPPVCAWHLPAAWLARLLFAWALLER